MSSKQFSLGDYKDILLAHEGDYRRSKPSDRQDIVDEIVDEITAEGGGKFEGSFKGIEQVSQLTDRILRSH